MAAGTERSVVSAAGREAEAAAASGVRVGAAEAPGFTPSWAVTSESQAGWRSVELTTASRLEQQLARDIINAERVVVGRSEKLQEQGFVLDTWLKHQDIQWSQRWQDVYNRALYQRTITGKPVNVLAGGGYTSGEVVAAEEGAAARRHCQPTNLARWASWHPPAPGASPAPR